MIHRNKKTNKEDEKSTRKYTSFTLNLRHIYARIKIPRKEGSKSADHMWYHIAALWVPQLTHPHPAILSRKTLDTLIDINEDISIRETPLSPRPKR